MQNDALAAALRGGGRALQLREKGGLKRATPVALLAEQPCARPKMRHWCGAVRLGILRDGIHLAFNLAAQRQ